MKSGYERRLYYRLNIEDFDIKPLIIPGDTKLYIGKAKDISSGGLSFFTNKETLIFDNDKVVDIIFNIDDKTFIVKLEIIREEKLHNRTVHAGMFVGVPNVLKDRLFNVLESIAKKEPALV